MIISTRLKYVSAFTVVVSILVYCYQRHLNSVRLETVLDGLLRAETAVGLDQTLRVAVGFGSCVDVIGPGLEILTRSGAMPPVKPEHFDKISNTEELEKVFTYFFEHGAAAERYTTNASMFRTMADIAKALPETKVAVGGNAPVMVNCFRRQGLRVLLGAQMSADLRRLVGWDVEVAGDDVTEDDIHLIMEYKKGEEWGDYKAVRANRFIIHNDANNPSLSALEKFSEALIDFAPQLIVISGLQMMDNFPFSPGERRARLDKLAQILSQVPHADSRIHFEMASFTEHDCLRDIVDTVIRYSDSLGMNEQELPNLLSLLLTDRIVLLSDAYPRVATTLDQMRRLFSLLRRRATETEGQRKVTRLHVHTLAFQAIITQVGSPWKNSESAAAKASLAASRHTCGSHSISVVKSRLLMDDSFSTTAEEMESTNGRRIPFNREEPVSCWTEEVSGDGAVQICVAPVLVCTSVVQTVGGGDNISSAGLVLQI